MGIGYQVLRLIANWTEYMSRARTSDTSRLPSEIDRCANEEEQRRFQNRSKQVGSAIPA